MFKRKIIEELKKGHPAIFSAGTLYGIQTTALDRKAVENVYRIKKRSLDKPFIILIASLKDLKKFSVELDQETKKFVEKYWPGNVSVILPCSDPKFVYLHRGLKKLAFRIPKDRKLRSLLKKSGPLISTTANPQGKEPAKTVEQARTYFKNKIKNYLDSGVQKSPPSTLIEIKEGKIKVLREGVVKIATN